MTVNTNPANDEATRHGKIETDGQIQRFAEHIADRYWETDADHRVTFASAGAGTLTIPRDRIISKQYWDIEAQEISTEYKVEMERVFREEKPFRDLYYVRTQANGERQFLCASAIPKYDDNGEFAGYTGVHRDETRARLRQEASDNLNLQLGLILEEVRAGIILWSHDERFVFCNDYFFELQPGMEDILETGMHIEEMLEKTSKMRLPDATEEERQKWMASRRRQDSEEFGELEWLQPVTGRWLSIRRQRLSDGSIVAIHTDITERKALEKAKDEFVSVAAHELKTRATSLNGALGLIKGQLGEHTPDGMEGIFEIAARNCERIGKLVGDLLDLSQIDTGSLDLVFDRYNLLEIVHRAVGENADYVASKKAALLVLGAETEAMVRVDRSRLVQALAILITNAAKFTGDDGKIELGVTDIGDGYRIAVKDNGIGIPEDSQEKVFEKFYQVDSSDTRNIEGTGLGLAICKAIIDQHDSELVLESAPGEGATFWFDLKKG